jgi:hypothetical protein
MRAMFRRTLAAIYWLQVGVIAPLTWIAVDPNPAFAADTYPLYIRTRYEAVDPARGGHFIIWLEREKMWHGLDPRLYPPVKYVEVTHITPAQGSPPITLIEVTAINATVPEFYHVAGIVRFKVTGMTIKASDIPQRQ